MTYYEKEIKQLKSIIYSNQGQIDTVIATRNYIDTHFDNELNLDQLSHILLISKFHLLRLFKRYYGLTPRQYLIQKRIERSKDFLKNGMTAMETCFAVGFHSPSSFSTLFKKKVGLSPTTYQKEQLSISHIETVSRNCSHSSTKNYQNANQRS